MRKTRASTEATTTREVTKPDEPWRQELTPLQYRLPVGLGPSLKTWPRWPPQRRHTTSVRRMNRPLSGRNSTASATAGWPKLGQPVPELNLASELNSLAPQPAHR